MSHFSGLVVRTGDMERSVGSENKELRRVVADKYEVIFKIIIKNKISKYGRHSTIQLKRKKIIGNKKEKNRILFDSTIAL